MEGILSRALCFRIHLIESIAEFFLCGNLLKKPHKMCLPDPSQVQGGEPNCQLVYFYVTAMLQELAKIEASGGKCQGSLCDSADF